MVVQGRDLAVGAAVGEVDRVPDALLAQRLAGVEVPAEEAVDGQRHVLEERGVLLAEEIVIDPVAIVQRLRRIVVHDPDLRPEAEAAHEELVGRNALLQMHDVFAALLVGVAQLLLVVDPADADPAAAGVGLHEQRIAEPPADLAEVEVVGVGAQRRLEIGATARTPWAGSARCPARAGRVASWRNTWSASPSTGATTGCCRRRGR